MKDHWKDVTDMDSWAEAILKNYPVNTSRSLTMPDSVIKDYGVSVFHANLMYAKIMSEREKFLNAFIAETGLKPSEVEMVQQVQGDKILIRYQKIEE